MDSTQWRLSAAAWSLLEALSGLRKTVHHEIDFIKSVSSDLEPIRLEDALLEIDNVASDISVFLSNIHLMEEEEIEYEYQAISDRFDNLEETIEGLLGR